MSLATVTIFRTFANDRHPPVPSSPTLASDIVYRLNREKNRTIIIIVSKTDMLTIAFKKLLRPTYSQSENKFEFLPWFRHR